MSLNDIEKKFLNLDGPNSPDFALSYYHLFTSLKNFLNEEISSAEKILSRLSKISSNNEVKFYKEGIEKLPEKWQIVVNR